jgi:hypothetical protein
MVLPARLSPSAALEEVVGERGREVVLSSRVVLGVVESTSMTMRKRRVNEEGSLA